jgi:hypothetical protein
MFSTRKNHFLIAMAIQFFWGMAIPNQSSLGLFLNKVPLLHLD